MINYLPVYERNNVVFNEILNALEVEFELLNKKITEVEKNMFIDTVIEMLNIYERDLAIRTNTRIPNLERREQIAASIRAAFDQTTEETIKQVSLAYGNGEIEIEPDDQEGVFQIRFTGRGIPSNLEGFKEVIDTIIPAHLAVNYTFTFMLWDEFDIYNKTWDDWESLDLTWSELEVYGEVI